jgi:hypothetical protein
VTEAVFQFLFLHFISLKKGLSLQILSSIRPNLTKIFEVDEMWLAVDVWVRVSIPRAPALQPEIQYSVSE